MDGVGGDGESPKDPVKPTLECEGVGQGGFCGGKPTEVEAGNKKRTRVGD